MKRLITLFIALAMVGIVQAEEKTLQGTVIDQDGKPIEGAIVSCSLLGYDEGELLDKIETRTEKNGSFTLKFDDEKGLPSFLITAPGYTPFEASSGAEFLYPRKQSVIKKIIILYNAINYVTGVRSTIVLPVTPDASLGRYFRYDRQDEGKVIFEREYSPQANIPYVIIPNRDFTVDISEMDLTKEIQNTIAPIATYEDSFIGSYSSIAYQTLDESHDYWPIDEMGDEFPTEQNDTISYMPKAMHAALILHFLTYLANDFEVVFHDPDEDYTPFVAKWKQWHVLGFSVGPYKSVTDYFFTDEEETIGEHTYLKLFTGDWGYALAGVSDENRQLQGLFREEDGRVYLYDKDMEQEYCVYDFTLEEGDTFDIGWGYEANRCVVTKVDHINVKGSKLKTITFSSISYFDEENELEMELLHYNHKWIEGIGGWSGPTSGWIPNTYDSSWSHHVAYVVTADDLSYYPFSFSDMWGSNNWVLGKELIAGERRDQQCELEYEITGGRLHVTGYMWLNNGDNRYIYCKISPTKDLKTYTITLEDENITPIATGYGAYAVDLYFNLPYAILNNDYDLVSIDENGVEHPVPNRDKYHPFIEEGKVWKLGWLAWEDTPAHELKYYFFGGDTIVNEVKGTRLMCQEMSKEEKNTYYVGSVREDDRVVYFTPADQSQEYVLYDFSAEVGDTLDIYCKEVGSTLSCIIDEKNTKTTYNGRQNRYVDIRVKLDDLPDEVDDYSFIDRWYEGIGRNGELENGPSVYPTGMYGYSIINCTVGNDTIWNSASTEDVTQYWSDEDSETKKQKIDFTHVIKTKPTSPQPVSTNISLLWGEYSNAVLNIDFEGMNGRYKINVRKDGEQQDRFSANQETHNLQSLDVNLAGYPDGDYTVVVENDGESFTAHFSLPLDGTGIESIQNSKFTIHNGADAIYDLSGRRVVNPKRGLYIQGGKRVLIKQ